MPGALPTMVCRPPTINGTVKAVAQPRCRQGDAGHHRRRRHLYRRRGPRPDLRPVHRRRPGADGDLGPGTVEGLSDADVLSAIRAPRSRWPCRRCRCWPRPSTATSRSTSPATRRWRPTARSPTCGPTARRSGPASSRRSSRSRRSRSSWGCPERGHVPRRAGRRLVRPAPVLRCRARGGRGVQGLRQAGEADVAPHRRLPARPHPPDVHLAGARHGRRGQRAHLRAAPHRRRDGLHARPRRDPVRDGVQDPRRRQPRLRRDDLRD